MLLFISITIAIRFSSRFFRSINNLILASLEIGKGNLNIKVPEIKTDRDMEVLNINFNSMINRLKNKYSQMISSVDKDNFNENLKTIIKQIKQIENLVNEFSDFARMPKPIFKQNNLVAILNENIKLLKTMDASIDIVNRNDKEKIFLVCDSEQLNRVFFNLIKNSIESIHEKSYKSSGFAKKIDIAIINKSDYIEFIITDNGIGFSEKDLERILKPYFTTKSKGSGLGLAIVNKIINYHNGKIKFVQQ